MSEFEPKPFGKYFLTEKIAVGGMAEIYKAKTFGVDGFEKQLAIKKILSHYSSDEEFVSMLTDEAKLVVSLSHTNIVQIYDLGTVGDVYYISMEYINGVNLREVLNKVIEKKGQIPLPLCLYIISEVCKGLDYAHSRRDDQGNHLEIVHRDISPQNILISYEGETKIVDFGIAKAAMNVSHTTAGVLKGKITYMSPEQSEGRPIDNRTDIFSTGLLLYELITGERFFTGESQFEILQKIRTTHIGERDLKGKVPDEIIPTLLKALAYHAEDRFETAGDFQISLTKLLYSKYLDFSPKQIATFMSDLFEEELEDKKRKAKEKSISAKAKSNIPTSIIEPEVTDNKIKSLIKDETLSPADAQSISSAFQGSISKPDPHDLTGEMIVSDDRDLSLLIKHKRAKRIKFFLSLLFVLLIAGGAWFGLKLLEEPVSSNELGEIQIDSNPPGAKIYLNGQLYRDKTPTTINDLPLEEYYDIELILEGFKTWKKTVYLESKTPEIIGPSFTPLSLGQIVIKTTPPDAEVFVNGEKHYQLTPTQIRELEIGRNYEIRINKEGYTPIVQSINVNSSRPQNINISLQKVATVTTPEITYGSIKINSTPLGADILINDKKTHQTTPTTIDKLIFPRTYEILIKKEGYESKSYRVDLQSEDQITINAELEKSVSLADIFVTSNVNQAEIFLNKRFVGFTPKKMSIKPGQVEIRVNKPNYNSTQKNIFVKEGSTQRVFFELSPKQTTPPTPTTGSALITSNPTGGAVYINQARKGITPLTLKLSPQDWSIEVRKSGYQSQKKKLKITAGKDHDLNFNLSRIPVKEDPKPKPQVDKPDDPNGPISLRVDSSPQGAGVTLNGRKAGLTPLILSDLEKQKVYKVDVSLPGYQDWSRKIKLKRNRNEIKANLSKE